MTSEKHTVYLITIKEALDPNWAVWLNGFEVHTEASEDGTCTTLLMGAIMDQAALRGVLNKIFDLNLELISLDQRADRVDPD